MSNTTRILNTRTIGKSFLATLSGKSFLATLSVAGLIFASATTASADHRRHDRGWHNGHGKKVVVIERHHKKRHPHAKPRRKVVREVHVYHDYGDYRRHRRPVKVREVHHHHYGNDGRSRDGWSRTGSITNETGGMVLGGIIGAVTGSQFGKGSGRVVAVAGGTIIGAIIGGHIGRSMDEADHATVQRSLETTPTGRVAAWKNPDTGAEYSMRPTRTYRANNRDCRDYEAWVFIDGYEQKVTGSACRMADGTWQTIRS